MLRTIKEETFYSRGTTLISNKLGKVRVRSHYGNRIGCVLDHRGLFEPSDVWFDVVEDKIIDNFGEEVTVASEEGN